MPDMLNAVSRVLPPGTILRFPAAYPYEPMVDFMVFDAPGQGCGLVVTTGYKSGFVAVILPAESAVAGKIGVDGRWLAAHWRQWVWPEGDPAQVEVLGFYPPPRG